MSTVYVDETPTWRVSIAAFISNFLIIGYLKASGILLIAYEEDKDFPVSYMIVVTFATSSALGIFAPLAQFLCNKITTRLLLCLSGFLLCFSFIAASFFLSEISVMVLLGFAVGFGLGMCFCPCIVIANVCFEKRRATAVGICFSGISAGVMVMPVLVTFLLDYFAIEGCLLILGAIMLNFCVVASMIPTKIRKPVTGEVIFSENIKCLSSSDGGRSRTTGIRTKSRRDNSFSGALRRYLLYGFSLILSHFGYNSQFYIYPIYADEFGYGRYLIASTLTVQGVTDLVFRLISGHFIDKLNETEKMLSLGVSMVIQGVSVLLMTWFMSFEASMVYSAIFGISGAIFMSIWTIVLLSIVGQKQFPLFISMTYLLSGVFNLPAGYLLGILRDYLGSFRVGLQISGVAVTISGLLSVCILFPCFLKFSHRHSKSKHRVRRDRDIDIPLT